MIGERFAGVFTGAVMHTPVEVTERAMETVRDVRADCLVAIGGGSTTGLGKAIALRTDLPQIVLPTSYAGSEMTPVVGQTSGGIKTTQSSPKILPEIVIYDVDLTMTMPPGLSATSGINAIAHAVEALYARDRNPVISLMAQEGIRTLAHALPKICAQPDDRTARTDALYGAWLCWHLPRRRRHGAASQALPYAGRLVQSAACGDPHRHPPACPRLQCACRTRGDDADRHSAWRDRRRRSASTIWRESLRRRHRCARSACPRAASTRPPTSP